MATARRFVSEPIRPEPGSGNLAAMGRGEPGLPRAFFWRERRFAIDSIVSTWKGHGADRGDVYVRRHWYEVQTACGFRMRLYFDRNPGRTKSGLGRWWLYTIEFDPEQ